MENASKALIMAGSVLMSVMIIGIVVLMFNKLSGVEQTKVNAEESSKLNEYSKNFEQYNRTIYGSELLSLANLQEDYNTTQTGEKGYEAVNITVKITNQIYGTNFFKTGTWDISYITSHKNTIEAAIATYEEKAKYKNKTVKYYAQISNREIAEIYNINYSSWESDYDIGERLKNESKTKSLMTDIENYKNYKSIYTEFKNKRFKCNKTEYGQTGRITSMVFTEI